MEFRRYTAKEISASRYYQLPKFLFEGEFKSGLSAEAKLLYSLLKDRFELSLRNNWVNKSGEIYLIYTRQSMCDMLGCKMQKIRRLLGELKAAGLMDEERPGNNLPNRIYLNCIDDITPQEPQPKSDEPEPDVFKPAKKQSSDDEKEPSSRMNSGVSKINNSMQSAKYGVSKIDSPDCRKSTPNETDINNINYIYNLSVNKEEDTNARTREEVSNTIKENIEYETLAKDENIEADELAALTEIIVDTICSSSNTIRVGRENRSAEEVKSRLLRLNSKHIRYVLGCLHKSSGTIRNVRAYLLTALYNAPLTTLLYSSSMHRSDRERSYDIDELERLIDAQYIREAV